MRLGALEAGGTKMVCAVCDENGNVLEQESFPTTTPEETLPKLYEYFEKKNIDCLGIACFGPADVREGSPTWGKVLMTPKVPWRNADVAGYFKGLNVPIGFDTDVNGSLIGETTFGIGKNYKNVVYFTIGTGVGAGIMVNGELVHGMLHPEAGHMLLSMSEKDPMKQGVCFAHPNCFEGLCCGPSLIKRWGKGGKELADRKEVWELQGYYIAQAMINIMSVVSPELIILGGGVMHQADVLLPEVWKQFKELNNGYIQTEQTKDPEKYIVCQSLNDNQGILGAAVIGQKAYEKN